MAHLSCKFQWWYCEGIELVNMLLLGAFTHGWLPNPKDTLPRSQVCELTSHMIDPVRFTRWVAYRDYLVGGSNMLYVLIFGIVGWLTIFESNLSGWLLTTNQCSFFEFSLLTDLSSEHATVAPRISFREEVCGYHPEICNQHLVISSRENALWLGRTQRWQFESTPISAGYAWIRGSTPGNSIVSIIIDHQYEPPAINNSSHPSH